LLAVFFQKVLPGVESAGFSENLLDKKNDQPAQDGVES